MTTPDDATPKADDAAQAASRAAARRARTRAIRRGLLGLGGYVLGVLALLALLLGTLAWLLRTEAGSAWLLAQLPGIEVSGARGPLLGDFSAQRIEVQLPDPGARLQIEGFGWRGLRIGRADGDAWLHIGFDELRAQKVELRLGDAPSDAPTLPPSDLGLPVEVELRSVRIDELLIDALGELPLRRLSARVHLGAEGGALHRLDALQLEREQLQVAGDAHIATRGELALRAQLELTQPLAEGGTVQVSAQLDGPLAGPQLQATLRAQPTASRPAQSLDLQAQLRPFAAWPLGSLRASASALDLSALHAAAPATALDIEASASTTGIDQPAALTIGVINRRAGRWNEGRLPLREIRLQVDARPDDPQRLEVRSFDALLGASNQLAGRISGNGHWNPTRWTLALRIAELQPQGLDARAPAMQLGGRLELDGRHAADTAGAPLQVDVNGEILGRLLGLDALPADAAAQAARQVQLKLNARFGALRVDVREALARAGAASASLSGRLTRPATGAPWAVEGQAALSDFDPLPWWPGRADSPWRQGPHRLNAGAEFKLQLPATDAAQGAQQLLAALRGEAQIALRPSRLAGVPLSGSLELRAAAPGQSVARLELDADGNSLKLDTRLASAPAASGQDDRYSLRVAAPALNRLMPLWRLMQGGHAETQLAGSLNADAEASGRWPGFSSSGTLQASLLRIDALSVQRAQGSWQLGTQPDAPLQALLEFSQLAWGKPSAESLRLQLSGTSRSHRIELAGDTQALPPVWVETLQPAVANANRGATGALAGAPARAAAAAGVRSDAGAPAAAAAPVAGRSLLSLQAEGGLVDGAARSPLGWRGSLQRIELRGDAAGAPAWGALRDIDIEAFWAGGPPRLTIGAGHAEVLGASLRFSRIAWRGAESPAVPAMLDARVQLEPLAVAPLLDRLQPGFGWGGDLRISGHAQLRSTPGVAADVLLERSSGDLTVRDDSGLRSMGLSDLRVGLNAGDGVWNFFVGLAGKTLGSVSGAVVARTARDSAWPAAATPIEGVLDLQVADIGVWGPWLPPGWRLEGALRGNAAIGGRFGAPEYTGQIGGAGVGVRNVLQGVQVRDGEIAIALQGDSARIERFTASAGNGRLELQGDASLGETPRADLQLKLERFTLLGRVDRRIVLSGQSRLVLGKDALALSGTLLIDEGLLDFSRSDAPTLGSDVVVLRDSSASERAAPASDTSAPPLPAAKARNVDLDLKVELGQELKIRGQGLDAELRGALRLTAPAGRLRVDGSVRVVNGTYNAYRQKLQIDRGVLTFNGPIENPQLDIEATRPNLDVRVGVAVTGTVLVPRVRLFSDTPMSDVEKLSWLLRGRASEGNDGADTALLQAAALALASGDEPGALDQMLGTLGLDDFSLRDADGSGGGTIVSMGRQLSRNWYVGYERSLNSATGNFQLIYRVAQRFSVRMQSGEENSIAAIWTWRWQ